VRCIFYSEITPPVFIRRVCDVFDGEACQQVNSTQMICASLCIFVDLCGLVDLCVYLWIFVDRWILCGYSWILVNSGSLWNAVDL
jgi:hypothetical protein